MDPHFPKGQGESSVNGKFRLETQCFINQFAKKQYFFFNKWMRQIVYSSS